MRHPPSLPAVGKRARGCDCRQQRYCRRGNRLRTAFLGFRHIIELPPYQEDAEATPSTIAAGTHAAPPRRAVTSAGNPVRLLLGYNAVQAEPDLVYLFCHATKQPPPDGSTDWSTRKLARHLEVSHSRVARVWTRAGIQPHRLRRYMASTDPEFEEKAADILGLYLKPPLNAAVFCVDEKSAIQALDRLDPVLPLPPGRAERHGFERLEQTA